MTIKVFNAKELHVYSFFTLFEQFARVQQTMLSYNFKNFTSHQDRSKPGPLLALRNCETAIHRDTQCCAKKVALGNTRNQSGSIQFIHQSDGMTIKVFNANELQFYSFFILFEQFARVQQTMLSYNFKNFMSHQD